MNESKVRMLKARANAVILRDEDKANLADHVNYFFDIAFGRTFSSKVEGDRSMFSYGSTKNEDRSLEDIFRITCFGLCETYIGRFTRQDGSRIEVLPEYVHQAIRYAELYQIIYGKEVKVDLIKS